ncbi:putative low-specificity L-threonine aldolase 1, partial [Cucurbita argyrosperma subsp. argyrosperma]
MSQFEYGQAGSIMDLRSSVVPVLGCRLGPRLSHRSRAQSKSWVSSISSISKLVEMVSRKVDLRSDTVTKPTDSMRAAMAIAEVDDDVLGYDPIALQLEEEMAKLTGKEAALFVPSGTMGNLISVLVHCDIRGSEVILGDNSHIHILENGGIATIGGVHPRTVKNNDDGTIDIDLIEAAIRNPKGELTGGKCLPVEYIDEVGELAKKHGLKLHIDGARIFNASIALGVSVDRLVQMADSVSVCLSKGLGAPVGSVIVGSKSFIAKAKRVRKTLGGGMRQIGILCAAALIAIKENVPKLATDHHNAKLLASGLNQINGVKVDPKSVETNIIFFEMEEDSKISVETLCKSLEERGIFMMLDGKTRARMVLHHQISTSDVEYTLSCFQLTKMVKRNVDLRSDTVTKPTEAMRAAMAIAEVDDDVLGNDPLALKLETEMAKLMGKEAALFVPSGTMGNLISVLVHCDIRGSEVILGDNSHIHVYENGGIATIGGVHSRTIKNNDDGTMDIDLIEAAIRNSKGELFFPTTRLICLENTHANSGGKCLPVEYIDKVGELATKHDLKLHIDGARIFNASIALGVSVDRLVQAADSVSVCLSKAALVAIKDNVPKLATDHHNAKLLASELNQINGLKVDPKSVETNIIFLEIEQDSKISVESLCKNLEEHGILLMQESSSRSPL